MSDNPPAFPIAPHDRLFRSSNPSDWHGMTLRDHFAGQALAMSQPDTPAALANWAYRVADAMLAERKSHEADRAFKEAGL